MSEEDGAFWQSTIGNTFLSHLDRRPREATDWIGFKHYMLLNGVMGEWQNELEAIKEWDAAAVEDMGEKLAEAAGNIWYS